jgi:hypothetical protein
MLFLSTDASGIRHWLDPAVLEIVTGFVHLLSSTEQSLL